MRVWVQIQEELDAGQWGVAIKRIKSGQLTTEGAFQCFADPGPQVRVERLSWNEDQCGNITVKTVFSHKQAGLNPILKAEYAGGNF